MTPKNSDSLLHSLLSLSTLEEQKHFLAQKRQHLDDEFAAAIKAEAETHVRADARVAVNCAQLLYHFATITNNPHHRGLGLFAEANACAFGGLGQYQRAIDLCDEAAALYRELGQPIVEADAQITKIYALTMLGQLDEALQIGAEAETILAQHQEWSRLVPLLINMALVYGRTGQDGESLRQLDRAAELCAHIPEERDEFLAGITMNRALVLRNLGRFDESIQTNQQACDMLSRLGQHAEVGHGQQVLAYTNYMLGRYNVALQILLQTKTLFESLARRPELLETELYICECYLQLRRFGSIIETSQQVAKEAEALGLAHEASTARMIETAAYLGLGDFDNALVILHATQNRLDPNARSIELATIQMQIAQVLFESGRWQESLDHAQNAGRLFSRMERTVESAYAALLAGRATAKLMQVDQATNHARDALAIGKKNGIPQLVYPALHLLGTLAEERQDLPAALALYAQAADALEQLSGQTMVEHRAQFMTDKSPIYEDMVRLSIAEGNPKLALETVERAKSRSLLTLLANRVNLSLQSRDSADQPLLDKLAALRAERDQLVHRLEEDIGFSTQLDSHLQAGPIATPPELQTLERRITEQWHTLLIHNADYAAQASLWQVQTESIQPFLDDDTLLLEYFMTDDELLLFVVTKDQIETIPLFCQPSRIQRMAEALHLNLRMVPQSDSVQLDGLLQSAQKILGALYQQLIAPAAEQLSQAKKLIIVPHDLLHYLPFHAFWSEAFADEAGGYLLEQIEVSYLPSSSILAQIGLEKTYGEKLSSEKLSSEKLTDTGCVSFGHSYQDQLPFATAEAQTVAAITGGIAYVGAEANRANFQSTAPNAQILHLATHGHFRADDPLFSGLAFADGWQTTLDTFNLKTNASLVTLSACQTGRSVIGGGDELLGLTRAFLAAGTRSLVLSQWSVEDRSTAILMAHFYTQLMAGQTKAAALQSAQQYLRKFNVESTFPYSHPYFWAPFFLIGDGGLL